MLRTGRRTYPVEPARLKLCWWDIMAREPRNLRQRKQDATRALLEETALRLFVERGYVNTTVDDIADAAGIAPRTFYRYFPAKKDVLFAYDEARIQIALGDLSEVSLYEVLIRLSSLLEEDQSFIVARADLTDADPTLDAYRLINRGRYIDDIALALAKSEGLDEPDLWCRTAAECVMAVMSAAFREWQSNSTGEPLHAIFERVVGLLGRFHLEASPLEKGRRRGGST